MPEQKKKLTEKATARQKAEPEREAAGAKPNGSGGKGIAAAIAVAIVAIAALYFVLPGSLNGVSFSTFKANYQNAQKVGLVATYYNGSEYAFESACINSLVQVIAYSRARSTIDLYYIDAHNSSCVYTPNGLVGLGIKISTASASACRAAAASGPTVYLNYSSLDSMQTYADKLYIYGNAAYFQRCNVTVNFA